MATKEVPVNYRTYHRLMKERAENKIEELKSTIQALTLKTKEEHDKILENREIYKKLCKIDILNYDEFVNNEYTTGKFHKLAKGLFTNRSNNYELVSDLFDLYSHSINQKKLYDAINDLKFHEKLVNINTKEYNEILKKFYTQVHKELILNGKGYAFGHNIGWICINRCVIRNKKRILDYSATKKREKELKLAGKKIFNKEEADWCKKHGIEYKAEDKRVYREDDHCYEVPLIGSKLPNAFSLKLEISDYRHSSLRGKTNEDLIKECNNDTNKICELPIDLRTKITLCDKVDKILYTKFIRNENQEPITTRKANRKN